MVVFRRTVNVHLKSIFLYLCPLFPNTDCLLVTNEAALKGALTTVESLVGGVGQLVAGGVTRCQERVQQQEMVCLQDKETVLQLLVSKGLYAQLQTP